ncbi:MAG: hypothetical protein V1824_03680, partial [archaeon]
MNKSEKLKAISIIKDSINGEEFILLDTNQYIFNYEWMMDYNNKHDIEELKKLEKVKAIFDFLKEKKVKIILPNIIVQEIKKVFKEKSNMFKDRNYNYN